MKFCVFFTAFIALDFALLDARGNEAVNLVIKINQGYLRGTEMVSTNGRTFFAFRGIPYAQPPLGDLRFQPPLPGKAWTGIFNATQDGVKCAQLNLWTFKLSYDEDCLTLNVYTPNIPADSHYNRHQRKSLLPVLVYIHEGLFAAGEASSINKPPQRLMNKDIVVVAIQFRLGPLGFLSTGDSVAPGNFGMLDQVLALQWVQENIGAFGGDARRVTICGQSAGGASVIYHMLSPLSKGLFRGAIAQSGSALSPWALQKDPASWARKLGREIQCPINDSAILVDCLRHKSVEEIINATVRIDGYALEVGPFVPVVEDAEYGRFITRPPADLAKAGKINPVPLIIGSTKDETAEVFHGKENQSNTPDEKFFRETLPKQLQQLTKNDGNLTDLALAVKEVYFDPIDIRNWTQVATAVTAFITDVYFKAPQDLTARMFASHNVSVYMYSFEYAGNVSRYNFNGTKQVAHEDDLQYIFNRKELTGRDLEMSYIIVDMWTNFVTYMAPTDESKIIWTPTPSAKELSYLEIGENSIVMKTGYFTERAKFWNERVPNIIASA